MPGAPGEKIAGNNKFLEGFIRIAEKLMSEISKRNLAKTSCFFSKTPNVIFFFEVILMLLY